MVHLECVFADSQCFLHKERCLYQELRYFGISEAHKSKVCYQLWSKKKIKVTYTIGKCSACTLMKEDLHLKSLSWKLLITSHLNSAACSHMRSLFFLNQALLPCFSWFKPLWSHYQALKPCACCLSSTRARLLLPGFAAQWPDVCVQPRTLQCSHTAAGPSSSSWHLTAQLILLSSAASGFSGC